MAELRTVNPLVVGSNPTLGAMSKQKHDMSHLLRRQVQILHLHNTNTSIKPGDIGTISIVDSNGNIFVEFSINITLQLTPTIDKWKLL